VLFSAHSGGHEVWQSIIDVIKAISEVMMGTLPNFWKIARSFLDGKFKKVS